MKFHNNFFFKKAFSENLNEKKIFFEKYINLITAHHYKNSYHYKNYLKKINYDITKKKILMIFRSYQLDCLKN